MPDLTCCPTIDCWHAAWCFVGSRRFGHTAECVISDPASHIFFPLLTSLCTERHVFRMWGSCWRSRSKTPLSLQLPDNPSLGHPTASV